MADDPADTLDRQVRQLTHEVADLPLRRRGHAGDSQDNRDHGADGKLGHRPPEPAHGGPPACLEARTQRASRPQIPDQ